MKFDSFYACGVGSRGGSVLNISQSVCVQTLDTFRLDVTQANCNAHTSCLFNNFNEQFKAQLSSALVVLGLTPSLLGALGPSVGEISVLSSKVPVISVLITLGAPAIYPTRVLDYDSPELALKEGPTMPSKEPGGPNVIIFLEHIFAAAAVANVLHNSWQLSNQTVFTPQCNQILWPLIWALMPLVIHIFAAVGYNAQNYAKQRSIDKHHAVHQEPASSTEAHKIDWLSPVNYRMETIEQISSTLWWYKSINSFATLLSYVHAAFGVVVFSSLQFICVGDAVGVLGRYVASALVCRVILIVEFARMRRGIRTKHKLEKGITK